MIGDTRGSFGCASEASENRDSAATLQEYGNRRNNLEPSEKELTR